MGIGKRSTDAVPSAPVHPLQHYGLVLHDVDVEQLEGLHDFGDRWLGEEDGVVDAEPNGPRHKVGCFLEVDLAVRGEPSTGLYDGVSETLQNVVQEYLLDQQSEFELESMTCRVLGPLGTEDELSEAFPGQEFRTLCEHVMTSDSHPDESADADPNGRGTQPACVTYLPP